jgi:hypothetical protein
MLWPRLNAHLQARRPLLSLRAGTGGMSRVSLEALLKLGRNTWRNRGASHG